MSRRLAGLGLALLLAGCGGLGAPAVPTERVEPAPWRETVAVDGEVRALKTTALPVPGGNFDPRTLAWVAPEGSVVRAGDLLARFEAERSRLQLDQARIELLRSELRRREIERQTTIGRATIDAEIAGVDADLALSRRYADADITVLARNELLDALADVGFLERKRDVLDWRDDNASRREEAELAVVDARRATAAGQAERGERAIADLEIRAPHDGVFMLESRWDGSRPAVGARLFGGGAFATLPDLGALAARFRVPQALIHGIEPGLPVEIRAAGTGQRFEGRVASVGRTATARSRESPVRFVDVDVEIAPEVAAGLGLTPGQALEAQIVLVDEPAAITVPNLALSGDGERGRVRVESGGGARAIEVRVGRRGAARSEILEGLEPGQRVLLATPAGEQDS